MSNIIRKYYNNFRLRSSFIRKPEIIESLLEALALQAGNEVSYHELANTLGIDQLTARRYIDMLEKAFVVFRLRSFWENFLVSERLKLLNNLQIDAKRYFWRTAQQQEVDYIEERDGQLSAYEFKWTEKKTNKLPATFSKAYPDALTSFVNNSNYLDFVKEV